MTVSYTADVANASGFGCFSKILIRWRGSVYKLIFKELITYMTTYFIINLVYRTLLLSEGYQWYRQLFEGVTAFCRIQMSSIPMTFGLGFYVSLIVKRWWDQYNLLPWPDSLAIFVVGLIRGLDERGRMMRRNIMRYVLLSYVIILRGISLRVRKRFPTLQHTVEAGLMREDELKIMESLDEKSNFSKWWVPLVWATNIVETARKEQILNNDPGMQTILNEISVMRKALTGVQHYDTISVPLVYTQVVTLAVYTYFGAALMGAQWVTFNDPKDYMTSYKLPSFEFNPSYNSSSGQQSGQEHHRYQPLDLYVPVFLILQFIFYVGWLKVAETLINPFGEDDDDFELNYLIDRHIQVSYMIVDDMHQEFPMLLKDIHWNKTVPPVLPYTQETAHYRKEEPKGSAEIKEEADNASSIYYRLSSYPLHRSSIKQKSLIKRESIPNPDSEYESIEHHDIFRKMRVKLRSQNRKMSHRRLDDDSNSIYSAGRKLSLDQKSLKSQRSIYKLLRSLRRKNDINQGQSETTDPDSGVAVQRNFYGRLASLETNEEGHEEHGGDHPHLSTITEQTTPDSTTHNRSRSNSRPVLPEIFLNSTNIIPHESPIMEHDTNYYPLDSDVSSQTRFTVEEVPNYEPIQVNNPTGSPRLSTTPKGSTTNLAKEVIKREMKKKIEVSRQSPTLPRRHPVINSSVASTDLNPNTSRNSSSRSAITESSVTSGELENGSINNEILDNLADKKQESITSAFDSTTFYV